MLHAEHVGSRVFSNINGVAPSDERFRPVWEVANDLGAIIHIHPTSSVGVEAMKDYWLVPLVGFPLDTTLAAAASSSVEGLCHRPDTCASRNSPARNNRLTRATSRARARR